MAKTQKNPFDEFDTLTNEANPFDEFDMEGPIIARPQPDNSANQWAGVLSGAVAPYLTAAGMGAAAGAPFAGVGAIPGAAGGVLSLGLGDIGTSVYNAAAPMWGGQRVALPSETIRNQFVNMGMASQPQTPGQRVAADVASGLAGGAAMPIATGVQAARTASPILQGVLNTLSQQRLAQAGAGAGAAAAPSIAQNYFDVSDPAALFALTLAGGMAGGRATAGKPAKVTKADLDREASAAYRSAEQAGVNVSPQAMADLKANVDALLTQMDYDPAFHPLAKRAAAMFEAKAGEPMSFRKLEAFRRAVRDLPYSEAGGAAGTRVERAMVGQASDAINDFMQRLTPAQTTSGNPSEAFAYLTKARDAARKNFEADLVEQAVDRAARRATGTAAGNLRSEFNKIAGKPNRMARLRPETQQQVEEMAAGKGFRGLQAVGKFAPQVNLPTLGGLATSSAGATYMGHPELAVLGGAAGGAALASKAAANRMAMSRANALGSAVRGTPAFQLPAAQIGAQTAQQIAQQFGFASANESGAPLIGVGQDPYSGTYFPQYGEPPVSDSQLPSGDGLRGRTTDTGPNRTITTKRR